MKRQSKYYAIRTGIECHKIVTSWQECKKLVDGYPKAEFKSFNSWSQAKDYLEGKPLRDEGSTLKTKKDSMSSKTVECWRCGQKVVVKPYFNNGKKDFKYLDSNGEAHGCKI